MKLTDLFGFTMMAMSASATCAATDFNSVVDKLLDADPHLSAERAAMSATILEMKTENNLPDPEIDFDHLWGRSDTKTGLNVTQSFDWPGSYSARNKMLKMTSEAFRAQDAANIINARAEISAIVVDVIAVKKSISLLKRITSGYDRLLEVEKEGYRNGTVSIIDLNKIKIEMTRSRVELDARRDQLAELKGRLLAIAPEADLESLLSDLDEFPILEMAQLEDYLGYAKIRDAGRMVAASAHETDRAAVEVAKMSRMPGFSVGYAFEREERENFNGFSIGMTIPVFSSKGKVAAARSRAEASALALESTVASTEASVRSRYTQMQSLKRQLDEYGPVIENSDNISLLTKAFEGRQINLTSYLQDVNYFIDAHLMYNEIAAAYYRLLVDMQTRYL